ncbi:hypothetical protein ARMGADRAFT_1083216 [Armillaria gallica]|uniref:Uncharacterized protein n=1 Tax=Armillaria gallica TaxID=47427 RepID=A0A2H3DKZ3_ARMGA|nr:hypothetical protein ARMGADRAFT_1083216 [Armillaria gallica]
MPEHDIPDPTNIVDGARIRRPRQLFGDSEDTTPATTSSRKCPADNAKHANEKLPASKHANLTAAPTRETSAASTSDDDEIQCVEKTNKSHEPEPSEQFDLPDPNAVDNNGFYKDVIKAVLPPKIKKEKPKGAIDVEHFFQDVRDPKTKKRIHCICSICKKKLSLDVSTCRWHMAALHKPAYYKFCDRKGILLMLAVDTESRRRANSLRQSALNDHAVDTSTLPTKIRYSADGLNRLCLEWGAATDQSIGVFQDPRFVATIQMAVTASSVDALQLLNCAATRAGYLKLSGEYLSNLKRLFASDIVKG